MSNVLTPKFRVSYPSVFQAKRNELNGKDEYGLVALFPKGTDLSLLIKAAQEVTIKKWGADKTKWPANMKNPFRKQEEKMKEGKLPPGHEEGAVFMNLKSKSKPGVVDQKMNDIIEPKDFYAGCYARASIQAFAYDQKGNRGVSFGLVNIQKLGDGDTLSGATKPTEDFTAIQDIPENASSTDLFSQIAQ